MRISDWSSDVCSSDLRTPAPRHIRRFRANRAADMLGATRAITDAQLVPVVVRIEHRECVGEMLHVPDDRRAGEMQDRKSVALGERGSVRVDLGGRSIMNNNKQTKD